MTPPSITSDGLSWSEPDLSAAAFVANNATVMGSVSLGKNSSVWYGAVIRGDLESITIGQYTNVQDGAILHGDPGVPTILEDYVTIGHRAVIHSAHIERGCLIGIGAIILNGVIVGTESIIGAGSVVTKNVPPRSLAVGVPAKKIKEVSDTQVEELFQHARLYTELAKAHATNSNSSDT